jgi:rhamnulokinase
MGRKFIAYDYGASSWRGIVGNFDGERLSIAEFHRFKNDPVYVLGHYYWDVLYLFGELKKGLLALSRGKKGDFASIGVDTWGVDFGLLDANGLLISNPFYYRDRITDGEPERVFQAVSSKELYRRTGIQFLKFNTLFQLSAIKRQYPEMLDRTRVLLFMPDLLNYFLTGKKYAEYSIASTSQMLNVHTQKWDTELLSRLSLYSGSDDKNGFLPELVDSGTVIGKTCESVVRETNLSLPVVAVSSHDTSSAFLAVPAREDERCAFLSCGTWSLLGLELDKPVTDDRAFEIQYTNEGGYDRSVRFLKNVMGLWIFQEVRRDIEREQGEVSFDRLNAEAEAAQPFKCLINPDSPEFGEKGDMTKKILAFCERTGQPRPESRGEVVRCVLESLALAYRFQLERLEGLLGYGLPILRVVGGGCQNTLLMRFTANATARPVLAGPVETTAVGNLCAQMLAGGYVKNKKEAREVVARSFSVKEYEPKDQSAWEDAYGRFLKLI